MISTLRIMTFNIRGSSHIEDGRNAWKHRAPLNVHTIQRCGTDVISFQELQKGNLETYKEQLPEYEYLLGPKTGCHVFYEYNAIFWRSSRFILLDSGRFWLSRTPDRYSSSWQAKCVRAATWAKLRCLDTYVEFLLVNTHLDHVSELARVEGCKLILSRITQLCDHPIPVILTGDFNCNPGTAPYRLLQEHSFIDTYLATGHVDDENSNTHHAYGWTQPALFGGHRDDTWRIDWLLLWDDAGRLQPTSCEIVRDQEPPVYPSDHYPVVVTLEIRDALASN
jgi:endonuclease/exonuclease/phosphatase family metal-dependent hydrolase